MYACMYIYITAIVLYIYIYKTIAVTLLVDYVCLYYIHVFIGLLGSQGSLANITLQQK